MFFLRLIFLSLLAASITGCSSAISSSKLGSQMPAARLYGLDGQIASLEDYRGQDLIVIFWGSSCSHSYSELQDLADWKAKNKQSRKYQVVAINIDKFDNEDKVKQLLRKLGPNRLVHSFSGNDIYDEAYVAFDVSDLPTIVRIDRSGKIVAVASSLGGVLD